MGKQVSNGEMPTTSNDALCSRTLLLVVRPGAPFVASLLGNCVVPLCQGGVFNGFVRSNDLRKRLLFRIKCFVVCQGKLLFFFHSLPKKTRLNALSCTLPLPRPFSSVSPIQTSQNSKRSCGQSTHPLRNPKRSRKKFVIPLDPLVRTPG